MNAPKLTVAEPKSAVTAVALVLHGGRQSSEAAATARQLAVLRMAPIAHHLERTGGPHGLVVARLRFAVRGWNGELQSPVHDARDALDELAERFPTVPIALVGHSMGGRTAIYTADHPAVTTVVGLAPWIESHDPTNRVAGRQVLLAHGSRDRITDARQSRRFVETVRPIATSAAFVSVTGDAHAMLRRPRVWNALTSGYLLSSLCGISPRGTGVRGTVADQTTNVLTMALAGEATLVV